MEVNRTKDLCPRLESTLFYLNFMDMHTLDRFSCIFDDCLQVQADVPHQYHASLLAAGVEGAAVDFCKVVTQTRNVADTVTIHLPWGSLLRGAFGHALRRLACTTRQSDCKPCPLQGTCPYPPIFESPAHARLVTRAPNPYVIEPPAPGARQLESGEGFEFAMVLIGQALGQLPLIVLAGLFRNGNSTSDGTTGGALSSWGTVPTAFMAKTAERKSKSGTAPSLWRTPSRSSLILIGLPESRSSATTRAVRRCTAVTLVLRTSSHRSEEQRSTALNAGSPIVLSEMSTFVR